MNPLHQNAIFSEACNFMIRPLMLCCKAECIWGTHELRRSKSTSQRTRLTITTMAQYRVFTLVHLNGSVLTQPPPPVLSREHHVGMHSQRGTAAQLGARRLHVEHAVLVVGQDIEWDLGNSHASARLGILRVAPRWEDHAAFYDRLQLKVYRSRPFICTNTAIKLRTYALFKIAEYCRKKKAFIQVKERLFLFSRILRTKNAHNRLRALFFFNFSKSYQVKTIFFDDLLNFGEFFSQHRVLKNV